MVPSWKTRKIPSRGCPTRDQGVTASRSPFPALSQVFSQSTFYKFNDMFTDIGKDLEGMSIKIEELASVI